MTASRYAIGGAEFVENTEERIEKRRRGRVQDRDLDLPSGVVPLEEIDVAVARRFDAGGDGAAIAWPQRGTGESGCRGLGVAVGRRDQSSGGRALRHRLVSRQLDPRPPVGSARGVAAVDLIARQLTKRKTKA